MMITSSINTLSGNYVSYRSTKYSLLSFFFAPTDTQGLGLYSLYTDHHTSPFLLRLHQLQSLS